MHSTKQQLTEQWPLHHIHLLLSCLQRISCCPQHSLWSECTCCCWPSAWWRCWEPHRWLYLKTEEETVLEVIPHNSFTLNNVQYGVKAHWRRHAVLLVSPHPYMVQLVPSAMWHSFTGRWIVDAPSDTGAGLENTITAIHDTAEWNIVWCMVQNKKSILWCFV